MSQNNILVDRDATGKSHLVYQRNCTLANYTCLHPPCHWFILVGTGNRCCYFATLLPGISREGTVADCDYTHICLGIYGEGKSIDDQWKTSCHTK